MNVMNSDKTLFIRYRKILLFAINCSACHLFLLTGSKEQRCHLFLISERPYSHEKVTVNTKHLILTLNHKNRNEFRLLGNKNVSFDSK